MPELRLVVLALQDKLAYGPTFEAALASLFGGVTSSLSSSEAAQAAPASASQGQGVPQAPAKTSAQAGDLNALIAEAGKDFADYERLTAEGKLGEAGQKLDELKRVLDKMNTHQK
jgi:uncharacterized membrane protein (UPF0182 family)